MIRTRAARADAVRKRAAADVPTGAESATLLFVRPSVLVALGSVVLAAGAIVSVAGQARPGFVESFEHPAIQYTAGARTDAVSELIRKIDDGSARLAFEPGTGYLRSVLKALDVPVDSQVAVFSQTSFQQSLIGFKNPRAIYFSDTAAVGWVRGGNMEIAAQDPRQGTIFYELKQTASEKPVFQRSRQCLQCHVSWETLGVPGLTVLSTGPPDPSGYATGGVSDHRTPFAERWGGWYVTGQPGPMAHMGNLPVDLPASKRPAHPPVLRSLDGQFDLHGYLTPYSDIVALMVLEHQARMTNLITDIGWEARVADFERASLAPEAPGRDAVPEKIVRLARTLVDYLLFVDEAPLPGRVEGSSGFAERFSAEGPRDSRGRSLRQLDLEHRLMRYPCSYLIYSPAFDALPSTAKRAIYARMWAILSGAEQDAKYGRLTPADRRAIVEILRDTKRDLPTYFHS